MGRIRDFKCINFSSQSIFDLFSKAYFKNLHTIEICMSRVNIVNVSAVLPSVRKACISITKGSTIHFEDFFPALKHAFSNIAELKVDIIHQQSLTLPDFSSLRNLHSLHIQCYELNIHKNFVEQIQTLPYLSTLIVCEKIYRGRTGFIYGKVLNYPSLVFVWLRTDKQTR